MIGDPNPRMATCNAFNYDVLIYVARIFLIFIENNIGTMLEYNGMSDV